MNQTFAVCQIGARMHYAVPRIFSSAGKLEALHTDLCAQKAWLRALAAVPRAMRPAKLQRLLDRVAHGVPPRRIRTFDTFGFAYHRRLARARTPAELNTVHAWAGKNFCKRIIERGLGKATAIYAFNTAAAELLEFGRVNGLTTVVEQTVAPMEMLFSIMAEEQKRFPDWESESEKDVHVSESEVQIIEREHREWAHADLIVCGSEYVREGVIACGGPRERCVVVPYGVDSTTRVNRASEIPPSQPLRVLTVGAVGLRKGSQYILEAARQLSGEAVFRLAGATSLPAPILQELNARTTLLGVIPRSEIAAEFARANVFLLPSLCEGSATAAYEALSHGLPVIATPNTGTVVRDGVDGFIVPTRDARAVAAKIHTLHADRKLLAEMSAAALQTSREYTVEKYGRRLLAAIEGIAK